MKTTIWISTGRPNAFLLPLIVSPAIGETQP
jgi:hypothetical protein